MNNCKSPDIALSSFCIIMSYIHKADWPPQVRGGYVFMLIPNGVDMIAGQAYMYMYVSTLDIKFKNYHIKPCE